MVVVGILVSFVASYAFISTEGWRWMFALGVVPAVILLGGMLFLPETPRWLMRRGMVDAARSVLRRVRRDDEDIEGEITAIREVESQEEATWRELLSPWVRPALVVGCGIAMFSQITGVNAIIYYSPTILSAVGFEESVAILTSVGVGVVLVVMTVLGMLLVDRVGRRRLLLFMIPGIVLSLAILGLAFLSPNITGATSWVVVICILAYIAFNGGSLSVVVWLIGSEIFPLDIRGSAMSLAALCVWIFDLVVSLTALSLIEAIGRTGTFWLYALISIAAWAFVYFLVPETKGRSLEEIEAALLQEGNFKTNLEAVNVGTALGGEGKSRPGR
jgi:sugar porter (SP) family MFS transporter